MEKKSNNHVLIRIFMVVRGISFYKMFVFYNFVTFRISQEYLIKWTQILSAQNHLISRNIIESAHFFDKSILLYISENKTPHPVLQ